MDAEVFISYRRDDTRAMATRLGHDLRGRFGSDLVFRDVTGIDAGRRFDEVIEGHARSCRVMLVLVGPRWQSVTHEAGPWKGAPRLLDPKDWVRREIRLALDEGVVVVPLLVDGAPLPDPAWLANCHLRELAYLQTLALRSDDYENDLSCVVDELAMYVTTPEPPPPVDHVISMPATSGSMRVRFGLLQPTPHFVGRADMLSELTARFSASRSRPRVQVLWGLGGVGKTHLTARFVADNLDRFGIVGWIRSELDPLSDLGDLACKILGVDRQVMLEQRVSQVLDFLSTSAPPWLLVYDNADDSRKLEPCLPAAGDGHILITTRSRELAALGTVLSVGELDHASATRYLLEQAPGAGAEADASMLAETLGNLPLALSHAGAYCANGTSFNDYQAFLEGLPAREVFAEDPRAGHEQTVASTWRPSIAAAAELSSLAPTVLATSAYFASDDIPDDLFLPLVDDSQEIRRKKQLADCLGALQRYALIERTPAGFRMHRLLQRVVRDDDTFQDIEPAQLAIDVLTCSPAGDPDQPGDWPNYRRLEPHVVATLATVEELADDLDPEVRLAHVVLLNRFCYYALSLDPPVR